MGAVVDSDATCDEAAPEVPTVRDLAVLPVAVAEPLAVAPNVQRSLTHVNTARVRQQQGDKAGLGFLAVCNKATERARALQSVGHLADDQAFQS